MTAPTLLLLHGLTDAGRVWRLERAAWGGAFRILAPDQLGHGAARRLTDEEAAREHPVGALVESTIELLEGEDAPVAIVGHSMGGSIAARVAALRPELVRALVLEDPSWRDSSDDRDLSAWRADLEWMHAHPAEARARAEADESVAHWEPGVHEDAITSHLEVDPRLLGTGDPRLLDGDWRDDLAALAMPTLILAPELGGVLVGERLADVRSIPNPLVEIAVVAWAGHSIRRDRPDAFHAVVDPFLAAHAR